MKIDMTRWAKTVIGSEAVLAIPVMTYPGLALAGETRTGLIGDGEAQARCVKALAARYPSAAAVTVMDLSMEAEAFGSAIRFSDTEVPTVTGHVVVTLEDARALPVPAVGAARTGVPLKAAEILSREVTDRPVLGGIIGPVSLTCRLMEMTPMMMAMRRSPETLSTVLGKTTEFLISFAKAFKAAGANGVVIAEPVAGLLSPKQCDEYSSRWVKAIVDAVQDEVFLVVLHNCGSTVPLVPSMVSTGQRVPLRNAVAMTEILPQVPADRLACGNINPSGTFRIGTPEKMEAEVSALLASMEPYPNFVLSSGCDIPPGTPVENVDAFFRALASHNASRRRAPAG
jgi:uroporphyrinogen decarboxylase